MRRFLRSAVCMLWVMCTCVTMAQAAEVIHSFDSRVVIHSNGTLVVTEIIVLNSEGDKIRQGIYRDIPLRYSGTGKHKGLVPFVVKSVVRDDKSLSASDVEYEGSKVRIYMREKGVALPSGRHTFVLTYATSRHVRYYEHYDELNWNVTGDGWAFPIEQVRCTITAPGRIDQTVGWLGVYGSKEANINIRQHLPDSVYIEGQRPIAQGEQMTVAVKFAKNLIDAEPPYIPDTFDRINDTIKTWGAGFVGTVWYNGLLIAIAAAYFLGLWYRYGRDPKKGATIPLFHPPTLPGTKEPLSPAAVLYVRDNKKCTPQGFAGLLLLLAQRGFIRIIEKTKGNFTLSSLSAESSAKPLPPDADCVLKYLHANAGDTTELSLDYHPAIREAAKAAKESLDEHYGNTWHSNIVIVLLGWFLVVPLIFFGSILDMELFMENVYPSMFAALGLVLIVKWRLVGVIDGSLANLGRGGLRAFWGIFTLILCGLAFLVALLTILFWFSLSESGIHPAVLWTVLALAVFATLQMKAPTALGRIVLDQIEGFTLYLKVAEKDRLAQLTQYGGPQDSAERFFSILPYAVALGCTAHWCSRYAAQIAAGLIMSDTVMVHNWDNADSISSFTSNLGNAVTSSPASAFSSDGGGGAGGGSGGGGGGGC